MRNRLHYLPESFLLLLLVSSRFLLAQTLQTNFWVTDGGVHAILPVGNTLYLGGSFSRIGPSCGNGVLIDSASGLFDPTFPKINGVIKCVVSDSSGGWYIGGGFTSIDGKPRSRLAHINADKTVDQNWLAQADSTVNAMCIVNDLIYIGGFFQHVGSVHRDQLAVVDRSTGATRDWQSNYVSCCGQGINVIAAAPNALYFGTDSGLGKLDLLTGNFHLLFSPLLGPVHALLVWGGRLYVGGGFQSVGGQTRNGIAALDTASGGPTIWNPSAGSNSLVQSLTPLGSRMIVGGSFSSMGGQPRNNLALLDTSTGNATSWNPNSNGAVYAVSVSGNVVYAGGVFTTLGGQARDFIAAIDGSTGDVTGWNPRANDLVTSVATYRSEILAGGYFSSVNVLSRSGLAAVDAATGSATSWNPVIGVSDYSGVNALVLSGSNLYVGGSFSIAGGMARNSLAAIDAETGDVKAWNPNPDGSVRGLATAAGKILVAGYFSNIGGQARKGFAALDPVTGNATGWNPSCNGYGTCIANAESLIAVGGEFTSIGGQARSCFALLDTSAGNALGSKPDPNGDVNAVLVEGKTVYIAGAYRSIGNAQGSGLAAVDLLGGTVQPFISDSVGWGWRNSVFAMALGKGRIYIGGHFTSIGNQQRTSLASFSISDHKLTNWSPLLEIYNDQISSICVVGTTVYVGGSFWSIENHPQSHFAALTDSALATSASSIAQSNPQTFVLLQNFPNPFNPSTIISYELPTEGFVKLAVCDLLGREVRTIVNGRQSAGIHSVTFLADNLPSGIYFYRLQSGTYSATRKLLILK
jgi:hypothetical protein